MKKVVLLLLAMALTIACAFTLMGCGDKPNVPSTTDSESLTDSETVSDSSTDSESTQDSSTDSDSSSDSEPDIDKPASQGLTYELSADGLSYTVTGIGTCTDTDIVIPSKYNDKPVTSIGYEAFVFCNNLTSIIIPDSIANIGDGAFYKCNNLTNVTIGNSVTSIGNAAFRDCSSLTSIIIPDSVTSIGMLLPFYECRSLTIYCEANQQPNTWDSEWNNSCPVVWNCKDNEIATDGYIYAVLGGIRYALKDGIATVVGQPHNITEVNIPTSVTYKNIIYNVTSIGNAAFQDCSSLTSITIPDSVTSIGRYAFEDCSSLTIYCKTNQQPNSWDSEWNLYCPVVWNCKENDIATDGNIYAVLRGIRYALKDGIATVAHQPSNITKANIPASVTYTNIIYSVTCIGSWALRDCYCLKSFTIPNTVTNIGEYAFSYCISLTSVTIPDSVTSIGNCAFDGCESLTYNIKNNVKYLGNDDNKYLVAMETVSKDITSAEIDSDCKIIYSGAFNGCRSLTIYCEANQKPNSWNSGWNVIDRDFNYDFSSSCPVVWNCKENDVATDGNIYAVLGGVRYALKDGIATIVKQPTNITDVNIPTNVTYKNIIYNVTNIGDYAFAYCSSLTSITIPDSITNIGQYAFRDCSSLTSIIIGNGVTSIENYAFEYCENLTNVHLTDLAAWCKISFGYYDANPLYYARDLYLNEELITELVIPDSVTSIGGSVFSLCSSLTSVTIPSSVTSIDVQVFYNCSNLTNVYYKGTEAEWNAISIDSWGNTNLTDATRYYYSETEPTVNSDGTGYNGNYWHYDENGEIVVWTKQN